MSEFTHYIGVTVPEGVEPDMDGEHVAYRLGLGAYVHKSCLIPADRVEIKPPPVVLPTTAGSVVRYRRDSGEDHALAMRTNRSRLSWRLADGTGVTDDWFRSDGITDLTVMYVAPEEGS